MPRLFPCQFLVDLIGVYKFSIGEKIGKREVV
jgi:hypothetical protein